MTLFAETQNPMVSRILLYLKSDVFMASVADAEWVDAVYSAYAGKCDILDELKKMTCWIMSDPRRKKKNYKKFIVNWLSRANRPIRIYKNDR